MIPASDHQPNLLRANDPSPLGPDGQAVPPRGEQGPQVLLGRHQEHTTYGAAQNHPHAARSPVVDAQRRLPELTIPLCPKVPPHLGRAPSP